MKPELPFPNSLAVLSLSYRLRNQSLLDSGYIKIIPTASADIIVYNSERPVLLLPTDDDSINIFVFEVEAAFTEDLIPTIFNVNFQRFRSKAVGPALRDSSGCLCSASKTHTSTS